MVFFDVLDKILRVLPVALVGAEGKNLILVRTIRLCLFSALPKRLHTGQSFIGLLVKILVIGLVAPAHRPLLSCKIDFYFYR